MQRDVPDRGVRSKEDVIGHMRAALAPVRATAGRSELGKAVDRGSERPHPGATTTSRDEGASSAWSGVSAPSRTAAHAAAPGRPPNPAGRSCSSVIVSMICFVVIGRGIQAPPFTVSPSTVSQSFPPTDLDVPEDNGRGGAPAGPSTQPGGKFAGDPEGQEVGPSARASLGRVEAAGHLPGCGKVRHVVLAERFPSKCDPPPQARRKASLASLRTSRSGRGRGGRRPATLTRRLDPGGRGFAVVNRAPAHPARRRPRREAARRPGLPARDGIQYRLSILPLPSP